MAKKKPEKNKKLVSVKKNNSVKSIASRAAKQATKKSASTASASSSSSTKKKALKSKAKQPTPVLTSKPVIKESKPAKEKARQESTPIATKTKAAPTPAGPSAVSAISKGIPKAKVTGTGKKSISASAAAILAKKRCREPACDHDILVSGFCRLHYIKNWRKIKRKEAILATGQLNNYVEELVGKYPDKYLDVIRLDLASEKDWAKVVIDLELEASEDDLVAEDEVESVTEGVRRDRDFDEDGDTF